MAGFLEKVKGFFNPARATPIGNNQRGLSNVVSQVIGNSSAGGRYLSGGLGIVNNELVRRLCASYAYSDPLMQSYTLQLKNNVIGAGITLEPPMDMSDAEKKFLLDEWMDFERSDNYTIAGNFSAVDIDKMLVESYAMRGEILLEKFKVGGRHGLTLRVHEPLNLVSYVSYSENDGSFWSEGIKFNRYGTPLEFLLMEGYNTLFGSYVPVNGKKYTLFAKDAIYAMVQKAPGQHRGLPTTQSIISILQQIGEFDGFMLAGVKFQAEHLVALQQNKGTANLDLIDNVALDGDNNEKNETGCESKLPDGLKMLKIEHGLEAKSLSTPQERKEAIQFRKIMLQVLSSALGMSANLLTNQGEKLNYSTMRGEKQEAQMTFRAFQQFFIRNVKQKVFEAWLRSKVSYATDNPFTLEFYEKCVRSGWRSEGWEHIDPMKEAKAEEIRIQSGVESPQSVIRKEGGDPERIMKENEEYNERFPNKFADAQQSADKPEEDDDDDGEPDDK